MNHKKGKPSILIYKVLQGYRGPNMGGMMQEVERIDPEGFFDGITQNDIMLS
jgi:hypothetical protein